MQALPQNGSVATITFSYETASTAETDFEIENCKIVGINGEKIDCEVNNTSITINKKAEKPSGGGIITVTPPSDNDDDKDITEDPTDDVIKEEPKGDEGYTIEVFDENICNTIDEITNTNVYEVVF